MSNKKPVVICVDDEKFVLDTLNAQLQGRFGNKYDFEFAERAEEALDLVEGLVLQGYTIAMIISDQRMPGISGDQFLTKMHQTYPLPIKILLTGQASLESAVNAINNANLYRYISKPWNQDDFLLTVDKGLQQFELTINNERQIRLFKQFVPENFIDSLEVPSLLDIKLGLHVQKDMSIFFSDIRGFTGIIEKMSPAESFEFVNNYLKCIEPPIKKNNGFIDKYLGDGVLALFNHTSDAIQAALDTQLAIAEFNKLYANSEHGKIATGIGVHSGELMLGIVGVENRLQCTVISDAVNVTSRLEQLNSKLGTQILISEQALKQIKLHPYKFKIRFIGRSRVKGKENPIDIFEVLCIDSSETDKLKLESKNDFENGVASFLDKRFQDACTAFTSASEKCPNDPIAAFYLSKTMHYMTTGVPEFWTGAEL